MSDTVNSAGAAARIVRMFEQPNAGGEIAPAPGADLPDVPVPGTSSAIDAELSDARTGADNTARSSRG